MTGLARATVAALAGPARVEKVPRDLIASHVRDKPRICEHGPFPDEELDPPIPAAAAATGR